MDRPSESKPRLRGVIRFGVVSALLSTLLAAPSPATADWAGWWNRSTPQSENGLYLGLSGSVGLAFGLDNHVRVDRFVAQPNAQLEHDLEVGAGVGLHARAGYRFHPRLAAEIQYEWISEWTIDGRDTTRTEPRATAEVARAEAWATTANLKLYLGTGIVQPYVVGGVGVMRFQGDSRSPRRVANNRPFFELNTDGVREYGFASRWGGGVDIYFNDDLSLVLGTTYVLPEGEIDPYDYLSFEWGLQYRF